MVTLETQVTIPSAWRRERVYFHVEKGIDDTAAVYVNGVKVGEVTQETPQYWMTTHRHRVPSDIIRFDQPNDIRIVTENLRGSGSFGSCPEMVVDTPPKTVEFAVDRCGHLGIGGSITVNGRRLGRMDASLAFPGTRWRFEVPRISMNLYNVLGHAAVPTAEGARVLEMRGLRELPTDGTAPWLLLFTGEAGGSPPPLVRERRLSNTGSHTTVTRPRGSARKPCMSPAPIVPQPITARLRRPLAGGRGGARAAAVHGRGGRQPAAAGA